MKSLPIRSILSATLIVGIVLTAAPAHARDVRQLKSSSNWVLDYADENCRLSRHFGGGKERVALVVDMLQPGSSFNIILVGQTLEPRSSYRPFKVRLKFGPNEGSDEITGVPGTAGEQRIFILHGSLRVVPLTEQQKKQQSNDFRRGVYVQDLPVAEARERAATWLELKDVFDFDLVLDTGPMDKPLASLRTCAWDLVRSWGLDIAQQKNRTRRVVPAHGAGWFRVDDYPTEMLKNESEAIVHVRIMVDEEGEPTSCHIQESTRPKAFDDVVCNVFMKRAKFTPALDAAGKPIKSYYQQTVTFQIE